jgi:hypothetical protein
MRLQGTALPLKLPENVKTEISEIVNESVDTSYFAGISDPPDFRRCYVESNVFPQIAFRGYGKNLLFQPQHSRLDANIHHERPQVHVPPSRPHGPTYEHPHPLSELYGSTITKDYTKLSQPKKQGIISKFPGVSWFHSIDLHTC